MVSVLLNFVRHQHGRCEGTYSNALHDPPLWTQVNLREVVKVFLICLISGPQTPDQVVENFDHLWVS